MERKEGFYWVKHINNWSIGYYSEYFKEWNIINSTTSYYDRDFAEIGEKIEHKS